MNPITRRDFLLTTGGCALAGLPSLLLPSPAYGIGQATTSSTIVPDLAFRSINARTTTLLTQMDRGLSYVGELREWVPRRDVSDVLDDAKTLSSLAVEISASADRLAKDQKTVTQEITTITASRDLAYRQLQSTDETISTLGKEWDELNGKLSQFDAAVRQSQEIMLRAQREFQDAVKKRTAAKCGFGEIVTAIGALVAIGSGTMAALPSLAAAASQFQAGGVTLSNLKLINSALQPAKGGVESIINGYNKIKPLLGSDGRGAMVVVEPGEVTRNLQNVLKEIDETKGASKSDKEKFKKTVRDYANAVEIRNNSILRLDNIASSTATLFQYRANTLEQHKALEDHLLSTKILDRQQLANVMRRVARNALRKLRDYLWLTRRAFDYSSLREYAAEPDIGTEDVGLLISMLMTTITDHSTQLTIATGQPQTFPVDGLKPFRLRLVLSDEQRQQLRSQGKISVSFQPELDQPAEYIRAIEVFANTVSVKIGSTSTISGHLTHLRTSRFKRSTGETIQYQLSPTTLKIATGSPVKLGSGPGEQPGKRYLGLSPFSDWLLEIDEPSKVSYFAKYIDFEFTGTMRNKFA